MKDKKLNFQILIFVFLVTIGSVRTIADIAGMQKISAVFAALNISPAMKVFTAHKGYETFSPVFVLEFKNYKSESKSITLTPELYRKLRGPYNRRNVYGAAISYGPVLVSNPKTETLFTSVAQYSFCNPGSLISELELNVPQPIEFVTIHYLRDSKNENTSYPSKLEVQCE